MNKKKVVEYLDKMIEAHKKKITETDCLTELSDGSISFCDSVERGQIHVHTGINILADALGVETKVEKELGSSPTKSFHYNGIKFFQLGNVDYSDVKAVFR